MSVSLRQSLSADDWASAALDALADAGMKGLAVEPLARRLGVTKGSFYWHFANRGALLKAALELWEHRQTDEVLERAAREADPRLRLVRLFREADGSRRAGRLYLNLTGATENRRVAEVVRRVMEHRLGFLGDCYRDMGLEVEQARSRAVLAYSVFIGTLALRRDAPDMVPAGPKFREHLEQICLALIPGYRPEMLQIIEAGAATCAPAEGESLQEED